MGSGFFGGWFIGPIVAKKVPTGIMRCTVGIGAVILAIVLFVRYY